MAQLQPSGKFHKAGPDALQDAVANFGELCAALQGTPYYVHLDAAACTAALAKQDQQASGWAGLTTAECSRKAEAVQAAAAAAVRAGNGTLLFKHVHKAGGSTLCKLAQLNMVSDSPKLPFRSDWDTNCVPFEAFLGPHPAVGTSAAAARALLQTQQRQDSEGSSGSGAVHQAAAAEPAAAAAAAAVLEAAGAAAGLPHAAASSGGATSGGRRLNAFWLGGACWLGFLTPPQLRALPQHYAPLTFVASEGPLPEALLLDNPRLVMVTMLRRPLDRTLSSYHWWRFMLEAMPQAPAECHAYSAPPNATLEQWLWRYPDNWQVRELLGRSQPAAWH
ncbi:hypothetical protein C2E21_0811 [Chlorella sorokiniana]|uniref:Sulfotransferase n=1 Tax=Chlorella sorokiniana TaxID=3076 RepID=A0A2P6U228_CHLSO|nr:hypothetical protein C2E21_0811 [Chlorella sorokiniana]|eukprot:PRW60367.1 hypothetical protein C2E21_0811 [Chlorella sorokiniana]